MRYATEWHGGKAYARCAACGKLVQANKPVLGGLHVCVTACERRGHHSRFGWARRVGPFWARRDQYVCRDCGEDITGLVGIATRLDGGE